jgi:chromosome segregation ATPase
MSTANGFAEIVKRLDDQELNKFYERATQTIVAINTSGDQNIIQSFNEKDVEIRETIGMMTAEGIETVMTKGRLDAVQIIALMSATASAMHDKSVEERVKRAEEEVAANKRYSDLQDEIASQKLVISDCNELIATRKELIAGLRSTIESLRSTVLGQEKKIDTLSETSERLQSERDELKRLNSNQAETIASCEERFKKAGAIETERVELLRRAREAITTADAFLERAFG